MNNLSLPFPAGDSHVSYDSYEALVAAYYESIDRMQRVNEWLHKKSEADAALKMWWKSGDGHYRSLKKLKRAAAIPSRQLLREQDRALKDFARSRSMRLYGGWSSCNWSPQYLPGRGPELSWCEICGCACPRRVDGHSVGFEHRNALSFRAGQDPRAVLVHTRHSFEQCEAYAAECNLIAERIGWSWHGPQYTAVLFTRGTS